VPSRGDAEVWAEATETTEAAAAGARLGMVIATVVVDAVLYLSSQGDARGGAEREGQGHSRNAVAVSAWTGSTTRQI
jgi:hypothetical protein